MSRESQLTDDRVLGAVDAHAQVAHDVRNFLHEHPELRYEEFQSSEYLAATLGRAGYAVERSIAGMATAFRAVLTGDRPGRTVGIVVVYDAVSTLRPGGLVEAVHSCGHGPLAGGVCAADGDVEEGTAVSLDATFLLFGVDEAEIDALSGRLRERIPDVDWTPGDLVCGVQPNVSVTRAVARAFVAAGRDFVGDPPVLPFATDFGNIARRVPAALIGVGRQDGWRYHTDEGAEEFAGPAGAEAALGLARVLALSAARLSEA